MRIFFRLLLAGSVLLAAVAARAAESAGQADLDKAFDLKLKAKGFRELGEVIRHCESALQKGLDEDQQKFANQLLSSTLVERGVMVAGSIFDSDKPDLNWPQFRDYALTDLEKAGKIAPNQAEAFYAIARLQLLPGGDRKRARSALDQALEGSVDAPDLRAKILTLRSSLITDNKQRETDLDEAVRISPGDPTAILARGLLHADLGKLDAALADLDKAIELRPNHAQTYEAKALVLAQQKKYDQAILALDMASELEPRNPQPLLQKGRIHALQGNSDAALHELDRAVELAPDNVAALLLRSAVHEEKRDRQKAIDDVDRVLKLKPNLPLAVRLRSRLLAGDGKLETAVEELEKFRKENPQDVASLLQLAMLYSAQQSYDEAIAAYTDVLAREPQSFLALRGRGDALLGVGKHAEAIADYERAYKLQPKEPGLLNNFAWVLATSPDDKLRNGRRAITLATVAGEQTEFQQAHILSTLAAAYAESGDFAAAVKWSEKALAAGSDEQKEGLAKELESYKARQPWRERQLPEAKTEKKPGEQKQTKPAQKEDQPAPKTSSPAEKDQKSADKPPKKKKSNKPAKTEP